MSTIVLNTSGFSLFKEIEGFDLLRELFPTHNIIIPEGVLKEFNKEYRDKPSFIEKKRLNESQRMRAEEMDLSRGEREAIVLTEDLNAKLVIDDLAARKECKKREIEIMGIFGIIRTSYTDCLLNKSERRDLVEKVKKTDFYYEDWLIEWTLEAEKEKPN